VVVSAVDEGFKAMISGSDSIYQMPISGKDESIIYQNCREWASNNIVGEFQIELRSKEIPSQPLYSEVAA
jgi:hypothetical protein